MVKLIVMRGEHMRRSAGRIFATGFLRSLLFFILFAVITFGSYKSVMHFLGLRDTDVIDIIPPVDKETAITEARIDEVSKHLIYCVDEEGKDIKRLILEIFDCKNNKLFYVTIPIKTQLSLSDSLHKRLILIKPSIPGFLKLSAISSYLPQECVYEYGVLMIEELLDIDISYYTVVPESIYNTVFENRQGSGSQYPKEVFSQAFIENMQAIKTETELRNYLEDLYTKVTSNLSFKDKLNYMEAYLNVSGKDITFELIAGEDSNSAYTINESEVAGQLRSYMGE